MSKQKGLIIGVILVAIILMAIGYAGLTETTLTINGTAKATADQTNFNVYFTGAEAKTSSAAKVETAVSAKSSTATVNINDLKTAGETQYAILEIENGGKIDATSVKVTAQGKDANHIDIAAEMCNENGEAITGENPLAVNGKTYVKVSATLSEILNADVETSIEVTITAEPDTSNT